MESLWTPKILESNFRGQNSMDCGVLYIIGKLLKLKYRKWAFITHLDIWNTSYGQKKGRESNCQFDSWPEKVGNRPDLLVFKKRVTYHWKALDETYNFASDCISIRGLFTKLWGLQSRKSPSWRNFGTPTRESRERKTIWMWALWRGVEYTIRGKVVASPKSRPWWVLCVHVARGLS
jgi:hypothetical protein